MPLKSETVDWIFAKMAVRYGASWLSKWNGIPMEAVAVDWARELERVPRESLSYAMGFLPAEFPPTVSQFKAICARAPERYRPAIAAAPADPERVREVLNNLPSVSRAPSHQWAENLRQREMAGAKLTPAQRAMWRAAIRPRETVAEDA